jgi:hypothetical protein
MPSQSKLTLDFAQRLGFKPVRDTLPVDGMDALTTVGHFTNRNGLFFLHS